MGIDLASPAITTQLKRWRAQDRAGAIARLDQWTELLKELERDLDSMRDENTLNVERHVYWRTIQDLQADLKALKESAE